MRKPKPREGVALDAAMIEGFQHAYLWDKFDGSAPTPEFHRTMWADAADENNTHCAWAAPRDHAKSTGISLTYVMAALMLRVRNHCMIVSDSEGQASSFLKDIIAECTENEDLRTDFEIVGPPFVKETETEFIMKFKDGHQFRIIAKGSEQKFRGLKWRNKRPNLIVGDDLEFDEIVLNPERLKKFKDDFFKQLMPCGSEDCLIRIVGTILHFNSLLMNLMGDSEWKTRLWSAHKSFDDFSEILWPERYDETYWRRKRQMFINQGKQDAYSQEFLNKPLAEGSSFFKPGEMRAIPPDIAAALDQIDMANVHYYISVDLAVSKSQTADYTCLTVGAVHPDGMLDIVDVVKARMDSRETVDMMFELNDRYSPEMFFVERGAIQKSIGPFLYEDMRRRREFFVIELITADVDKTRRAQGIRARMKAGLVRFDTKADWWPDNQQEMSQFPRGAHDDFVDTLSQFGIALDTIITPPSAEDLDEEEYERESRDSLPDGRSPVTGY